MQKHTVRDAPKNKVKDKKIKKAKSKHKKPSHQRSSVKPFIAGPLKNILKKQDNKYFSRMRETRKK